MNSYKVVTPAKAGVQRFCNHMVFLDAGFRRHDDVGEFLIFYQSISNHPE